MGSLHLARPGLGDVDVHEVQDAGVAELGRLDRLHRCLLRSTRPRPYVGKLPRVRTLGLIALVVATGAATIAAEVLRARRARRMDGWASLTDPL